MSGSRSKKSGGKYDNPKAGKTGAKTAAGGAMAARGRRPEDVPLGTGMADKAKKDLQEMRNKRFPDPSKY